MNQLSDRWAPASPAVPHDEEKLATPDANGHSETAKVPSALGLNSGIIEHNPHEGREHNAHESRTLRDAREARQARAGTGVQGTLTSATGSAEAHKWLR
jgi:hypothetical protein